MNSQYPPSLCSFNTKGSLRRSLGDRISADTSNKHQNGFTEQYVSDDLYTAPNDQIVSYLCQMAGLFHGEYKSALTSLAYSVGLSSANVIMGNIKSEGLALNKAETDYNGDPTKVKDYLRATIACDNPDQIIEVMDALRNDSRVIELTDKFSKPEKKRDWRGAIAIVHIADGFYAELQVLHKGMLPIYEKTHRPYEDARACQRRRLEIEQYFQKCERDGVDIDPSVAIAKALEISQLSDREKSIYALIKPLHSAAAEALGLNTLVDGIARSDFAPAASNHTGVSAIKPTYRHTRFGSRVNHKREKELAPRNGC